MFRPISEQISANVLPSRFARPEGLNKFSVERYLVLFWKLPNFTLKLTPHNLQKSSTLSSLAFLPLTGFVGVFPLDFKYSPWEVAMRAVKHQQSETFRAKIIGSFELQVSLWLADLIGISWGDKSGRHSKNHGSLAGGISRGFAARGGSAANSHSTGTAAPPPNLSPTIPPAMQANVAAQVNSNSWRNSKEMFPEFYQWQLACDIKPLSWQIWFCFPFMRKNYASFGQFCAVFLSACIFWWFFFKFQCVSILTIHCNVNTWQETVSMPYYSQKTTFGPF